MSSKRVEYLKKSECKKGIKKVKLIRKYKRNSLIFLLKLPKIDKKLHYLVKFVIALFPQDNVLCCNKYFFHLGNIFKIWNSIFKFTLLLPVAAIEKL